MYNIVTIERRYASGGNEIGKKLAEALGYKLYDRNILIKAAKNLEIPYFQIEDLDESTAGGILMNLAKTGLGGLSGNRELPLADKLFLEGFRLYPAGTRECFKSIRLRRQTETDPESYRAGRNPAVRSRKCPETK